MIEAFFADLHACPDVDAEIAAGRLVFSAITLGGLLHPRLVKKFCPLVTAGLYQEGDFCWLDLQLPDGSDGANNRVRRWFPDPVSQCLIGRWQAASHCWPEGNAGTPVALVRKIVLAERRAVSASSECAKCAHQRSTNAVEIAHPWSPRRLSRL